VPVPTGVFAASEDWAGAGDTALAGRIDRAAAELVDVLTGRPAATRPVDPFADPTTSFEELLRGS
jgi:FMN reductase